MLCLEISRGCPHYGKTVSGIAIMPLLVLLFILMPALELVLLIKLGSHIGALTTVSIVFITAILGASLLRREGFSTLMKAQKRLESGQLPASEVVEGALLVVAGAFLLTPGFITDAIGFACLLPGLRHQMAAAILKRVTVQVSSAGVGAMGANPFNPVPGPGNSSPDSHVIEGEFQRKD